MYYSAPDKLAMAYDQESEGLVINGTKLYIRRGGKTNKGDTRHNKQMDQLSETLFSCLKGNLKEAELYFRDAAEQGEPTAQYNLGALGISGQIEMDDKEAIQWLSKSAANGYEPAFQVLMKLNSSQ